MFQTKLQFASMQFEVSHFQVIRWLDVRMKTILDSRIWTPDSGDHLNLKSNFWKVDNLKSPQRVLYIITNRPMFWKSEES